jgi:hypothetical protein
VSAPATGTASTLSEATLAAVAAARRLGPAGRLVEGVLDLAGARSLALDALLSVSSVEWNAEVTTACVECVERPRVLLNPTFVERFCGTRERLAMLMLHELSHISLGHTRLYPRVTAVHNLAFDAVINASSLRALGAKGIETSAYAALFEEIYAASDSPWFLLRPPPGWPAEPDWEASSGCDPRLREIHGRLYSSAPTSEAHSVTYTEIITALVGSGVTAGEEGEGSDDLIAGLLGSHGRTDAERVAETSGRDARAAEHFGPSISALQGSQWGAGGESYVRRIERVRSEQALVRALSSLIVRVFVEDLAGPARRREVTVATLSPDPSRDRRAHVRRAAARVLGAPAPLLFSSPSVRQRPERRSARVYIDVSGSMNGLVERLHAALVPLRRMLAAEVFVFSTGVIPVSRADFLRGELPSTGGTSIEPVLRHLASDGRSSGSGRRVIGRGGPRRALVLTDGLFVSPTAAAKRSMLQAGHEIHLGVLGSGPLHERETWVASSTRLPDSIHRNTGAFR